MSGIIDRLTNRDALHKKMDDYHAMPADAPVALSPGEPFPDPNYLVPFGVRNRDEGYNQTCFYALWIVLALLLAGLTVGLVLSALSRSDDADQNLRLTELSNDTAEISMNLTELETRVAAEEGKSMQLMDDTAQLAQKDMILMGNVTDLKAKDDALMMDLVDLETRVDQKDMVLMSNVTDLQEQIDIILGMKPNITMKLTDLMNATIDLMTQAQELVDKDMLLMDNVTALDAKDNALMMTLMDLQTEVAQKDMILMGNVTDLKAKDDALMMDLADLQIEVAQKDMVLMGNVTTLQTQIDLLVDMGPNVTMKLSDLMMDAQDLEMRIQSLEDKDMLLMTNVTQLDSDLDNLSDAVAQKDMILMQNVSDLQDQIDLITGAAPNTTMKLGDLMDTMMDLQDKDMVLMSNISALDGRTADLESTRISRIQDQTDLAGVGTSGEEVRLIGGTGVTTERLGNEITFNNDGVLSVSGAGSGISVSGPTSAPVVQNTGVHSIAAPSPQLTVIPAPPSGGAATISLVNPVLEQLSDDANTPTTPGTIVGIKGGVGVTTTTMGNMIIIDANITMGPTPSAGVTDIVGGTGITVSPPTGMGTVTISSSVVDTDTVTRVDGDNAAGFGSGDVTFVGGTGITTNFAPTPAGGSITITNNAPDADTVTRIDGDNAAGFTSGDVSIVGGTGITTSFAPTPAGGTLTINGPPPTPAGGVTQIVAGTGVTISPAGGTGVVTINAPGGGSGVAAIDSSTCPAPSPAPFTGTVSIDAGTGITKTCSPTGITFNNGGVLSVMQGTGITVGGTASDPVITNDGVTSVVGGTGISTTAASGAITLSNDGVLGVTGGTGVTVTGPTAAPVITNDGVLSVTAGTGVTLGGTAANPIINAAAGTPTRLAVTSPTPSPFVGGDITIAGGAGVTTTFAPTPAGGTITITAAPAPSPGSGVSSVTASGGGISASPTTGAVVLANTGVHSVTSTSSQISVTGPPPTGGAVTISAPTPLLTSVTAAPTPGISIASPTPTSRVITNTGVTSNVAGLGISLSGATGAVTITNTGVRTAAGGTGIGVSASTGAVTISNTGVTSAVAGAGIGVSGPTGAVTVSNTGVRALASTSGQITITNPPVSGGTASINVPTPLLTNVVAAPTPGISVTSPTPTTRQISNTGVTSITGGTGITASSSTGAITLTNDGVTSLSAGAGISLTGGPTGAITVSATGGSGGILNSLTGGQGGTGTDAATVSVTGTNGISVTSSSVTDTVTIDGSALQNIDGLTGGQGGGTTTGSTVTITGTGGVSVTRSGDTLTIDGSVTPATVLNVYVDAGPSGNDGFSGTAPGSPVKTIQRGLEVLANEGPAVICILNLQGTTAFNLGASPTLDFSPAITRCRDVRVVGVRGNLISASALGVVPYLPPSLMQTVVSSTPVGTTYSNAFVEHNGHVNAVDSSSASAFNVLAGNIDITAPVPSNVQEDEIPFQFGDTFTLFTVGTTRITWTGRLTLEIPSNTVRFLNVFFDATSGTSSPNGQLTLRTGVQTAEYWGCVIGGTTVFDNGQHLWQGVVSTEGNTQGAQQLLGCVNMFSVILNRASPGLLFRTQTNNYCSGLYVIFEGQFLFLDRADVIFFGTVFRGTPALTANGIFAQAGSRTRFSYAFLQDTELSSAGGDMHIINSGHARTAVPAVSSVRWSFSGGGRILFSNNNGPSVLAGLADGFLYDANMEIGTGAQVTIAPAIGAVNCRSTTFSNPALPKFDVSSGGKLIWAFGSTDAPTLTCQQAITGQPIVRLRDAELVIAGDASQYTLTAPAGQPIIDASGAGNRIRAQSLSGGIVNAGGGPIANCGATVITTPWASGTITDASTYNTCTR
jgi:hypothetical protein